MLAMSRGKHNVTVVWRPSICLSHHFF